MKKVLFALALATTFVACEEKKADGTTPETPKGDSPKVEVTVVTPDTAAAAANLKRIADSAAAALKAAGTKAATEVKVATEKAKEVVAPK